MKSQKQTDPVTADSRDTYSTKQGHMINDPITDKTYTKDQIAKDILALAKCIQDKVY